jgi:RHS repeat-associated protein
VLPGDRTIAFGYDAAGNPTTVTPPGRPPHQIGFSRVNLPVGYGPPDLGGSGGATSSTYDADRRPTRVTRPDGSEIGIAYDATGHLLSITTPRGEVRTSRNASTGQLTQLAAPGGITLGYAHDGALPTEVTWSGPISGTVSVTRNSNAQVASQRVNGGSEVAFAYDDDGLLTHAGGLSLSRDPGNGLVTGTALGAVVTTTDYDGFADLASFDATAAGAPVFHTAYTRDGLGRITQVTETVEGATATLGYIYDAAGRLAEVRRNGSVTAAYGYDANGNRTSYTGPGASVTPTYDAQDRLLTYGATTYTYTAAGDLRTRTDAAGMTTYRYDALGNLITVTLPDGTELEYLVDGKNRRIGKRVNGALIQGFLYQGQLAPVAELNGNGEVVNRFVYGTRSNVPELLIRDGVIYRIVTDHLGSVRLVLNTSDGTVAQRLHYDEFGRVTQNTNPGFQPFGYAGGLYDGHTGLVRFGARDYDALVGRWTAKDPIGFGGGSANLYAYVENDPINLTDPSGLRMYTRCEAENFLRQVRDNASDRQPHWWDKHAGGDDFDFKAKDLADDILDDYYEVGGKLLRSDEFGNFAAGYAGIYGYGLVGYVGVIAGGIRYDYRDARNGDGTFDFDMDSWPAIHSGVWRALKELPWSPDENRRPSASEEGCPC